jgi:ketopantoate reductase
LWNLAGSCSILSTTSRGKVEADAGVSLSKPTAAIRSAIMSVSTPTSNTPLAVPRLSNTPAGTSSTVSARCLDARPSMLLDYNAGRRCEVDAINGAIPRLGRPLGVTTPVNDTVVGIIRARERRMLASMVTQ